MLGMDKYRKTSLFTTSQTYSKRFLRINTIEQITQPRSYEYHYRLLAMGNFISVKALPISENLLFSS